MRMDVSDESLARAAADGDRQAFALLVERVYDRVYGYAVKLTGSRTEAEDLAQDLCAALPAKLQSFRGEAKLTTWLYRITVNAARDRFRRAATRARAADGWGDWELARQAEIAETADRVAVMYAGRIVETGPVETIIRAPRHPYTKGLIGSIPTLTGDRDTLTPIPGAVPPLSDMPRGCAFHPRCTLADTLCQQTRPEMRAAGVSIAACHHLEAEHMR